MALYAVNGREVDVAIDGIPFMLATEQELPQVIETLQVRKEQFDTETDPGEQSLAGYWRRSQASFHEGAGNLYQESNDGSNRESNGYFDSRGVDVFSTKGRFSLLKTMTSLGTTANLLGRLRTYSNASTRTNLCTNPSFETNTTGWSAAGTTPTLLRTSSLSGLPGFWALHSTWPNGAAAAASIVQGPSVTTTIGSTYTFSGYVRNVSAGTGCTIRAVGGGTFTGSSYDGTDINQQLSVTFIAAATSTSIQFVNHNTAVSPASAYIDGVLMEETSVLKAYFDGTYSGASWTGTAHASTSTTSVSGNFFLSAVGSTAGDLYSNSTGTFTAVHSPAGKTIVDGIISGATFYDVASDGTLYQGDISAPGSATTWPCGTTPSRLGWGKHRLWIIGGRKLWQPDLALAGGTSQNPIFTHPNLGWTYTCMAEGPSAMYFAGHDGLNSSIQSVTMDTDLAIPILSGAVITAVMPDGELVREISVLAGQFVGIGTTRGFRMGRIDANASIVYGPLLFEGIVTALTAIDRYFVVGISGSPTLLRVDTSTEITDGVFAYAHDVEATISTSITSIANNLGAVAFTTANGDTYTQSSTYVTSGYVQSGRIRFRTTEDKSFKYVNVECEPLPAGATVVTDLILENGSTVAAGTISATGAQEGVFTVSQSPQRFISLKITLNKGTSDTPALNSYLLRALPATTPHRLITLPLLCFDKERSRSGQTYGSRGYANTRLAQLQALEDAATTAQYQNFADTTDGFTNVVIEGIRFVQTSAPRSNQNRGDGGILILTLKTVPV